MHSKKITIPLLTLMVALAGYGVMSYGQPNTPMVEYEWTAPTTGSQVLYYKGQREVTPDGGTMYTVDVDSIPAAPLSAPTTFIVPYAYGSTVRFRVAGVDSLGRTSPWSQWSSQWIDQGPPGVAGTPRQTLVIQ